MLLCTRPSAWHSAGPSDQPSSPAPAPPPSCQNAERHKNKPIHSRRGKTHWLQRLSLMQSPLRSTERKMVKQKSPSQEELCATEAVAAAGCFLGLPSSPCNPPAGKPAACWPRSAKMRAASHVTSTQMIQQGDLCTWNDLHLVAN